MCRLVAYIGVPIFIETLLVRPRISLVVQSLSAREAKTVVNADGCGVGWYGEREEPGVYRGILPAWSDTNLASLCRQIKSRLFLAHVRSATSGEVATANCHPFTSGPHLFMHNGQIGDYDRMRRVVDALIPDNLYAQRRGTSDSEAIFLAALGHGLEEDPQAAVTAILAAICAQMRKADIASPLRFAAIHSDGATLRAFRWASDGRPPSLYWRKLREGVTIASEPFDEEPEAWTAVPPAAILTVKASGTARVEALEVEGATASRRVCASVA